MLWLIKLNDDLNYILWLKYYYNNVIILIMHFHHDILFVILTRKSLYQHI